MFALIQMYKEVKETKIIFIDLRQNWDKTSVFQLYLVLIGYTGWNLGFL